MLVTVLKITQIVLSILLALFILIQHKQASLSITNFGGEAAKFEKRGPEKVLHIATVVLGILWTVNAIVYFVVA